ncbi:MAG: Molybdopterin biosynthesis protein MoeA [uncultured Sulfurovum sp.]|uniref:Molybdopterin molybdenumtransferase n=1 Tax=uncultured Sulfurovum sp. TaxID=269237 RepID=A0A6S6SHP0_9BACT|nr:MAG: Molybdopterin biosynthesis protein MoeA [uncultured Sulfurovum sp.]
MTLSIEQALETIYTNVEAKSTHILAIEEAIGSIVAKDYAATFDLPRFDNSAMDGYAIKVNDTGKEVQVKEVTYAGDIAQERFNEGEVVKIMTGAPIPSGAEAIVAIEHVELTTQGIMLPSNIKKDNFIRFKGEDIQSGTVFLKAQTKVTAYTLALLASQGITHIEVYRKPKVVVFSTGEELKAHYEKIEQHQLYNSNAPMFAARAKELGCDISYISSAGDNIESLKNAINNAKDADLILTSGGVSVGDKDFTKEAFIELGMTTYFSGIDIKPGRPTNFGKLGKCFVINLPGNPLAAMVNFEMFVKPSIAKLSGTKSFYHGLITTKMESEHHFKAGKNSVILGTWNGTKFSVIKGQKPGMVAPLDKADGMIISSKEIHCLKENQVVKMIAVKIDCQSDKKEDFFVK